MSNYPGPLSGGFVSHRFQSLKPDQPDLSLVNPTQWNQSHIIGSGAIQSGALGASTVNSGNIATLSVTSGAIASGATSWNLFGPSKPFVVVTVSGPSDGGDYGPGTSGTSTAGIQEAILYLYNNFPGFGGTVYIRQGTYNCSGQITLRDRVMVVGAGKDSTVLQVGNGVAAGLSGQGFVAGSGGGYNPNSSYHSSLRDIHLIGNFSGTNNSGVPVFGLDFSRMIEPEFNHVMIDGFGGHGLFFLNTIAFSEGGWINDIECNTNGLASSAFDQFHLDGATQLFVSNCYTFGTVAGNSGSWGNSYYFRGVRRSNFVNLTSDGSTPSNHGCRYNFYFESCQYDNFTNLNVLYGGTSGVFGLFNAMTQVNFDNLNLEDGLPINSHIVHILPQGNIMQDITISNFKTGLTPTGTGMGLYISSFNSGILDHFTFSDCAFPRYSGQSYAMISTTPYILYSGIGIKNCPGVNNLGQIPAGAPTPFWSGITPLIGVPGQGNWYASPVANTDYYVYFTDIIISASGGNSALLVKDPALNSGAIYYLQSGSVNNLYVPQGFFVNFGTFTSAPASLRVYSL